MNCILIVLLKYFILFLSDILITTPNRLVHMLNQDPPTVHLHR